MRDQLACAAASVTNLAVSSVRILLIPCISSTLLSSLVTRGPVGPRRDAAAGGGVVPLERRRRKWEQEEERQERDRALNELFHGEDLLDEPDPEENDDWVETMRDDRPMNAVCDDVFAACDNTWSQDSVEWRAPRLDGVEGMVAVSLRQSRAVQVGNASARRPEAVLIRSARRERVGRRPLLCRSSIAWLAACLMLGTFCFGGAAWFSSVPDRPTRANTTSTRVTYVTKNIEDVRKGETVVAWDPVTGELGRDEVTNTFERTADHLRVLEFAAESDGQTQTLETTDEHPFWSVEAGDFVAARDLRLGDRFISPAGEISTLTAMHRDDHPEGVPVYNFEVADVHNYYVRAHGLRAPPVRVHNAEGYVAPKGPKYTEPTLPSRTIVNRNGVRVEHYTRGNEHMPAHAHVVGGGSRTRIGANGKPLGGDPELSPAQKQVVDESLPEIRKSINKIRRWWRWNFHLEEP